MPRAHTHVVNHASSATSTRSLIEWSLTFESVISSVSGLSHCLWQLHWIMSSSGKILDVTTISRALNVKIFHEYSALLKCTHSLINSLLFYFCEKFWGFDVTADRQQTTVLSILSGECQTFKSSISKYYGRRPMLCRLTLERLQDVRRAKRRIKGTHNRLLGRFAHQRFCFSALRWARLSPHIFAQTGPTSTQCGL